MSEFIVNFHFMRPYWLILLLLPVFFYWKFMKGVDNQSSWEKVCDKNLLEFLLIKGSSSVRRFMVYAFSIGFIFSIIAAAGPTWKKREIPALIYDNPVMILLNLSSDMYEKDIAPNRLTRAKHKIADLLGEIKNAQAGLIVYTEEPFLISPITDDFNVIKNLLPPLDFDIMPTNGDRLDRAIEMAHKKLEDASLNTGNIVVFTSDVGQKFDLTSDMARGANNAGYKVSVIKISDDENEKLSLIVDVGGGVYSSISANDADIKTVAALVNNNVDGEFKTSKNLQENWEDYGYYLVIIPLLCCLCFFRRGVLVLLFLIFSTQAQAGFFANANEEGLALFNQADFTTAAETFKDSNWKASAYYRSGNFEKAYEEFAKNNDIEAMYNQGNALAKGGKIEEAIKKYEEVLEIDANHEDAKFNLEYLKQQQENQQSDGDGEDDKEEKNQEEQQQQQNQEQEQKQEESLTPTEEEKGEEQESKPKEVQAGEEETEEMDEEALARELQYREVPEDPGGLLRAFIEREYEKKRYEDE